MLPYARQSVDESDVAAVAAAVSGEYLTTGPAVARFEADLAGWTGGHPAVAVTSGTAALHTAYAAAGIGAGQEVVVPPLTFVATAATAALLGARVVFADVDERTGCLDPAAAAAAVTDRTAVVTAVDYAGLPADMDALRAVADDAGALLMEDAAHSIGTVWRGRPVGSLADLTTLSFFATKNLTTAEGGAVVSTSPELVARAAAFRNHGLVRDPREQRWPDEGPWHQEVHALGLNYRLPDVLCALGSSQLARLAGFVARRAEISARYDAALADVPEVRTPHRPDDATVAWHLYPARVPAEARRALFEHLRAAGIGVQVNYVPAHWHPAFADLGYRRGECPVAEQWYREEISLPLFVGLADDDVDRVCELVRRFFGA
ncbi:DegT/DnrJ/EryC1/StrS aminotransferase family protein [Blastococcus sp. KM273129]|uniref:DegT/DnrJ/EryC1/StrS family aminotransferase n=1 Tax=Blastococcus sp. KM273129 TaxID=2570315 RepID=UPI001F3940BD|nr:DegT/DnrJ/EryC1/StrS family aminotransferase [Blastococcus sp. KM273129]MCF6735318.1 UDP-4-amino-4,6-dideoxy-N-acetyl-beta-L-altrosamine transaminase [Blastococcus sp. KM273129]